jgi:hypothetical protein
VSTRLTCLQNYIYNKIQVEIGQTGSTDRFLIKMVKHDTFRSKWVKWIMLESKEFISLTKQIVFELTLN